MKKEEEIKTLFLQKRITLSFAESCTGGALSSRIVEIPGASDFFLGSIVAYSNQAKTDLLNVPKNILDQYGAVSKETAYSMAKGAQLQFGTDISLATTGIAGPSGGSKEKPVGLVWVGLSKKGEILTFSFQFQGDRKEIIRQASEASLEILLSITV